jgi:hypothetical protein
VRIALAAVALLVVDILLVVAAFGAMQIGVQDRAAALDTRISALELALPAAEYVPPARLTERLAALESALPALEERHAALSAAHDKTQARFSDLHDTVVRDRSQWAANPVEAAAPYFTALHAYYVGFGDISFRGVPSVEAGMAVARAVAFDPELAALWGEAELWLFEAELWARTLAALQE